MKRFFRRVKNILKNIYLVIKYPFIAGGYNSVFDDTYSSVREGIIFGILKGNFPTWTWYDQIDLGWKKCFGKQLLDELKTAAIADGVLDELYIYDIKEKYGELRISVNITSKHVNKVIEKYEYISYRTCGKCGLPADKISDGWVYPYCEKCAKESTVIGFNDYDDWYGWKSVKSND